MTLLPLTPPSAVGQPTPSTAVARVPSPRTPTDTVSLQHAFEAPTDAETALASAGRAVSIPQSRGGMDYEE